jgi:signal transduction histidine kinase
VAAIQEHVKDLTGNELEPTAALGMFRDSCRWTLFALRTAPHDIRLSRAVVHAPAFVADNVIGGIAFCGTGRLHKRNLTTLRMFARFLLNKLRLLEEQHLLASVRHEAVLNRARTTFAQGMAHAILGPLNALHDRLDHITHSLDLMRSAVHGIRARKLAKAVTELKKTDQALNNLRDAGERQMLILMSDDVERVLELKRIEVNVRQFFELLVFVYKARFQKAGKTLVLQPIPIHWVFTVDKTSIWEVFSNLLANALASPRSTKAQISGRKTRTRYRFAVTDDGGVDPLIKDHLFQPLFRTVHEDPLRNKTGTRHGLGLYFARMTLGRHDGKIYLDDSYKNGAKFVVDIPVHNVSKTQKGNSE